jgi:hypothetical protein
MKNLLLILIFSFMHALLLGQKERMAAVDNIFAEWDGLRDLN